MTVQYGFYFDADRCINCYACEVACKSFNKIELGVHWRKTVEIWSGEFPQVSRTFVSLSCLHCAEPACAKACPADAIMKRLEDGIVVVDREKCTGCGICYDVCPYGVPQFGIDRLMQKCNFCIESGGEPACVAPCPANALFFGTMEELVGLAEETGAELLAGKTGPSLYIRNTRNASIPDELLRLPG
jgi:Fe-S-cluster-containing dehydrogenase component